MHNIIKKKLNTSFKQKEKLKKFFNILLFISVLCFIIVIIYSKFFSKNINITPFGIQILKISSNSMIPEFDKNDIIIIKKQKKYKKGDIITYVDKDGNLITHRIIEECENGFYTKGDNNNTKDEEKVIYSQIAGKVIVTLKT